MVDSIDGRFIQARFAERKAADLSSLLSLSFIPGFPGDWSPLLRIRLSGQAITCEEQCEGLNNSKLKKNHRIILKCTAGVILKDEK